MTNDLRETSRALAFLARHPGEAVDRMRSKAEAFADGRGQPSASVEYEATENFEARLHEQLGVPFPCGAAAEFGEMWTTLEASLADDRSFVGEWIHDSDPGLGRTAWCLVRHLRPRNVIETGVARGITSRILLEAMEVNAAGHLWSVDLPRLRSQWHDQTAAAVPGSLRTRWTYVRGSSRRRLPELVTAIGELDVFIHDSAHTETNMRFEFETAWPALRPSGVLVSHDVGMNGAFAAFAEATAAEPLLSQHDQDSGLVGVLVKGAGHV
jgi:predicted O-methyltransferase YrrM